MIKVPPSSLGFKHVFVVPRQGFRTKNKRVSNPCFCLRFRELVIFSVKVYFLNGTYRNIIRNRSQGRKYYLGLSV